GIEFMGEIPFDSVYLHGTVRDLTGKKMSKSLGNIIDPIDVIDEFGADALRFSMIAITSTGQDVYLSKEKFHIGRNFANKIWNASRFVLMNVDPTSAEKGAKKDASIADKWILSRLNRVIRTVDKSLENYRFNDAEMLLYDFFWHDFCDWYVEMVKPEITGENKGPGAEGSKSVLIYVLENSLKLLHPFMPFVTERVWQNIEDRKSLVSESWPKIDKKSIDNKIESNVALIKDIIISIRNIRADMNIPHSVRLKVYLSPLKKGGETKLKGAIEYIKNLARLEDLVIDKKIKKPKHSASAILEGFNVFIPLEGIIDFDAEKVRLSKKMADIEKQVKFSEKRLKDKNFVAKAPEKIVNIEKERKDQLLGQIDRLKDTLKGL
ncbi:MAG: class I tRNA ligase family protein, partial [Candidatus Omnitrophota bacterium]|nr:class I tRNA ligase family protein [Candidatus Omnitrophota bacterium]